MTHPAEDSPRTCVVVSYWAGRPAGPLHRLLGQMQRVDPGVPFDLVVVCNGGDVAPLRLPARFDSLGARVFNRENVGYNIAAWEHGWRSVEGYETFLFIQDDCYLKGRDWVAGFERRYALDPGIGLLGEFVAYDQMTWEYIRATYYPTCMGPPETWDEPRHPIDAYRSMFDERGVPWSDLANHLPSIILFSSRRVLEEIGGFPYFGPSYREAVGSEFATSRLVESKGYRISQVSDYSFEFVGHPQWASGGQPRDPRLRGRFFETYWKTKALIRRTLGPKRAPRKSQPLPVTHG